MASIGNNGPDIDDRDGEDQDKGGDRSSHQQHTDVRTGHGVKGQGGQQDSAGVPEPGTEASGRNGEVAGH